MDASFLTEQDCRQILENNFEKPLNYVSHKIEKLSENVVGFLGEHWILSITYHLIGEDSNRTQSYFMKTSPKFNEDQADYVAKMGVVRKETLIYKNLMPNLLRFSAKNFAPQPYLVKLNKFLVAEDLAKLNYKVLTNAYLGHEKICAVLQTLANFHASSLIYEARSSMKINEVYGEEVCEATFSFEEGHPRQLWWKTVLVTILDLIELKLPQNEVGEVQERFKHYFLNELPGFVQPSMKFRNVLIHDDLWCNNLMFNPDTKHVLLVDFQLAKYAPPALDFLVFLFMNVEYHLLLGSYPDIYYTHLAKSLKLFGLEPDSILSRNEWFKSLEYYKVYCLVLATMYGTNTFVSQKLQDRVVGNIAEFKNFMFLNRSKYILKEYEVDLEFRQKLDNVFIPLLEHFRH